MSTSTASAQGAASEGQYYDRPEPFTFLMGRDEVVREAGQSSSGGMPDVLDELRKIMEIEDSADRVQKLESYAKQLGCTTAFDYDADVLGRERTLYDGTMLMARLVNERDIARSAGKSAGTAEFPAGVAVAGAVGSLLLLVARTMLALLN